MSHAPLAMLQNFVSGKSIVIFGLGLQGGGVGVANTLKRAGAHVHVLDNKLEEALAPSLRNLEDGITYQCGENLKLPENTFLIVKNPAVPYEHPMILEAESKGIAITTEAALALHCIRDNSIGITGTRGKTTTTTLTHALLRNAGLDAILCGNIPNKPLLSAVEEGREGSTFVIELSSFQLEGSIRDQVSPHIAVVTNVYPDHLNRYKDVEEYARVKAGIFLWQKPGDHAVLADWHDWTQTLADSIQPEVKVHLLTRADQEQAAQLPTKLPGEHNSENIAFALKVAEILELPRQAVEKTIAEFSGVPFRLEIVAEQNGLRYINDTTSTTPIALQKALEAQTAPYVLILGGTTKHLPLEAPLLELLTTAPKGVVALNGSGTTELLEALGQPETWVVAETLAQAVKEAESLARATESQTILFSPGFSSFELFDNEFDRGRQFNELVQEP
jgi:UDP-N-acetylmuramoylalanine--D-glutamate ligase